MIEIDDLNRAGKVLLGKIPDPFGPIAHDDLLFGAGSSRASRLPDRCACQTLRRSRWRRCRWWNPGRGWRSLPRSQVVWVNTHPNLTSRVWAGWPSVLPCRPTVSFFTTGTPVPSICTYRMGTGSPTTIGRSNCMARWISCCSPRGDILSDGLRRALHGFGGHLQIGE